MNVVKFPTKYRPPLVAGPAEVDASRDGRRAVLAAVLAVLVLAWTIIRMPVFLVLYWLRMPVTLLCNLISMPSFFVFLFAWYAFPEHMNMVRLFGVVSFVSFVGAYLYDVLLMAIAPGNMMRML